MERLLLVAGLTALIHLINTVIYAVRVAGVRTDRAEYRARQVILAPGQFAVIRNGKAFSLPLLEESKKAALEALHGHDPTDGAVYFNNMRLVRTARESAFWNSLARTVQIGNHTFFRE